MCYYIRWLRGRVSDYNAEGWGSNPGTNVRGSVNPAVNRYLGQPVALGTVEAVGRNASHITLLLTEAMETP